MNILVLHAGSELYGADKVLLELLNGLDKEKFTPYVILPSSGPLEDRLRKSNINVLIMEYPILRRKYFNLTGMIKYMTQYIKYSKQLLKFSKENNIDVVHTNTTAVLEGIAIKLILKIPQIWHVHEIIVKPKFIHKMISFLVAKTSDDVITVSNAVASHLNSTGYFKKKINVIYNGVDNKVFTPTNDIEYLKKEFNIPEDTKVVGMIGRVNSWKGQKDFVIAMDNVMESIKDVYAVMVGGVFEGEEWRMADLKEEVNNSQNKERIVLSNYREDTPNIHNMFDIFVLPSTNPDPLPTVVLEAMATGKPVVGYAHGGVCEMVDEGENGLLSEVNNPLELAKKIKILLKDDILRMEFGKKSLDRQYNLFSLNSYVKNFEEIYSKYNK